MPTVCCAPGCKTGYLSDRKIWKKSGTKKALFSAPKDPHLFRIWQKLIPRRDRKLTPKDFLCEIHFEEEDIERNFKTLLLFDGSTFIYPKERVTLRRGAIPTKFPNVPGYNNQLPSKKVFKRKYSMEGRSQKKGKFESPDNCDAGNGNEIDEMGESLAMEEASLKQNYISAKFKTGESIEQISQPELRDDSSIISESNSRILDQTISCQTDITDSISDNIQATVGYSSNKQTHTTKGSVNAKTLEPNVALTEISEPVSFEFLKNNIHMIDKNNSWWTLHKFDEFIICSRWNSNFIVERKIVIKQDLTFKVFLFENETNIGYNEKILSLDNVSRLIFRIERILVCPGIFDPDGKCDGFLQAKHVCRRRNLCLGCLKWQKEKEQLEKKKRKEKKLSRDKVELIKFHFNT